MPIPGTSYAGGAAPKDMERNPRGSNACEKAVAMDPTNGAIIDSRVLNRESMATSQALYKTSITR